MNVDDIRDIFPQRLKEAMKERDYTPAILYHKLGFTFRGGDIYDYLNGKALPSAIRLAELSKILHVSTDWLLGLTDEVMR